MNILFSFLWFLVKLVIFLGVAYAVILKYSEHMDSIKRYF